MPIIFDLPSWMVERNFIRYFRLKNVWIQTFPTLKLCTRQGHAHTMYTVQSKTECGSSEKMKCPKPHFTNEISWRHDKRNLIIHHFATFCYIVLSVQPSMMPTAFCSILKRKNNVSLVFYIVYTECFSVSLTSANIYTTIFSSFYISEMLIALLSYGSIEVCSALNKCIYNFQSKNDHSQPFVCFCLSYSSSFSSTYHTTKVKRNHNWTRLVYFVVCSLTIIYWICKMFAIFTLFSGLDSVFTCYSSSKFGYLQYCVWTEQKANINSSIFFGWRFV